MTASEREGLDLKKNILIVSAAIAGAILILVGLAAYFRHRGILPLSGPPAHGTSFIIEAEFSKAIGGTNDLALLRDALLKRSDKVGVRIYWEPISETRIRVMAATRSNGEAQQLQNALLRRGRLELRLVHEQSDQLIEFGESAPGYELLQQEKVTPSRSQRVERVIVKKKPEAGLSGNLIKRAMVVRGNLGEPEIHFALQPEAAAAFAQTTRDNIGRRLALVIDGKLYSAPTINSPIETGDGMIVGNFDLREAVEIAGALDSPLPFAIKVVESNDF